ncbi:MAG: SIS domain-containing protein [Pseudohongiellaceae bacterium]
MTSKTTPIESALRTIEIEKRAIDALKSRIGGDFESSCQLILNCSGRVVVVGIGKSGHIARKVAATLASTGTPAIYVHAGEANHGDIGMITKNDVVMAISNSGKTEEIINLLPFLKRNAIPVISLTGDTDSELGLASTVNLDAHVAEEACPLGLAPTSSTTAALVMGDALAMALLEARGFTQDDFASSHPGGNLGRRLLVRVKDIMHSGEKIPMVKTGTPLTEALLEMSKKGFGLTTIVDSDERLKGVFTDGDLRRAIDSGKDLQTTLVDTVMSKNYKFISSNSLATEAALSMQNSNIYVLISENDEGFVEGIVKMHDLLEANVV